MKVIINGQVADVPQGLTVQGLLEHYQLKPDITIVEKNQVILERTHFASTPVLEDDTIELIRYMGGG